MKVVATKDSVGMILCHDITQIIPGEFKGRKFKKGHLIKEEDIEVLLSLGKDHIYVWEEDRALVHENDAAEILKNATAGENLTFGEVKEGKIDFYSSIFGIAKIDKELLKKLNSIDEVVMATIHTNTPVKKGEIIAGTRIIPLAIQKEKLERVEKVLNGEKIVKVLPFKKVKVGMVTTGNEVFYKRIEDKFGPVIIEKFKEYNGEVVKQIFCKDDKKAISDAIKSLEKEDVDIIICTGGMSVDPDDVTPSSIKECGARIVSYGSPVLPGSMFLLAYKGDKTIMGLPGCVMYSKRTVFDLILPRVLSGEKISKEDIIDLGHGGMCLNCDVCTFPRCNFGK